MAQQSARRDRENQSATPYLEYAGLIWTRSANSHAGRRLMAASRGRTDGSLRLRVITILKFPLAQKGASTDVVGSPKATLLRRTVPLAPLMRTGIRAWVADCHLARAGLVFQ